MMQSMSVLVLTDEQVADMLAVPKDTVRNLHRIGKLKGILVGKHLRWRPADVIKFVETTQPVEE